MRKSKSKVYWLMLVIIMVTGILLIINVDRYGLLYANLLLWFFWLIAYIVNRKKRMQSQD